MNKFINRYIFLFVIAGAIILFDQWTKHLVRTNLAFYEILWPEFWLSQFARIIRVKNYGAAFGMFQSLGNVFMVLSFIVTGAILYYFPQIPKQDWILRLSMGMLLGGAVGNLIDRLTLGYVTDFVSIGMFPVFNVADASISTGVVVLFIGMTVQERREKAGRLAAMAAAEANAGSETAPDAGSESTGKPVSEGLKEETPGG